MRIPLTVIAAVAVVSTASSGFAQPFDTPSFQTPFPGTGVGAFLLYPDVDEPGGMALWRQAGESVTLGLRGGAFDVGGDRGYLFGVDLNGHGRDEARGSFAGTVVGGFGVGWIPDRDVVQARVPLGFTWGWRHETSSLRFFPYFGPRAVLDVNFAREPDGDRDWEEDLDLNLNWDLGFDVEVSRSVRLRFGGTVGHDEALGAGISIGAF